MRVGFLNAALGSWRDGCLPLVTLCAGKTVTEHGRKVNFHPCNTLSVGADIKHQARENVYFENVDGSHSKAGGRNFATTQRFLAR